MNRDEEFTKTLLNTYEYYNKEDNRPIERTM